jgi:hypothetical protein
LQVKRSLWKKVTSSVKHHVIQKPLTRISDKVAPNKLSASRAKPSNKPAAADLFALQRDPLYNAMAEAGRRVFNGVYARRGDIGIMLPPIDLG